MWLDAKLLTLCEYNVNSGGMVVAGLCCWLLLIWWWGRVMTNASWAAWDANRMMWCLFMSLFFRCYYCCVVTVAAARLLSNSSAAVGLIYQLSSLGDRPRERPDDPTPPGAGTVVAYVSGVFGSAGGRLYSERTGVSLVIPEGAIPEGVQQEVYFKVCQDDSMLPPLDRCRGSFLARSFCLSLPNSKISLNTRSKHGWWRLRSWCWGDQLATNNSAMVILYLCLCYFVETKPVLHVSNIVRFVAFLAVEKHFRYRRDPIEPAGHVRATRPRVSEANWASSTTLRYTQSRQLVVCIEINGHRGWNACRMAECVTR